MHYLGTSKEPSPAVGTIIFDTVSCTTQVWNGTSWDIMALNLTPDPDLDFTIKVYPEHCALPDTCELYFKILDTLSWMVINNLENNPNIDLMRLDDPQYGKHFRDAAETLLRCELLTNIKVTRVAAFVNHSMATFNKEVQLCIAVQLDQHYIDNYDDIVAQQLIKSAIENL